MLSACAVADCSNVGFKGSDISFHRFPKKDEKLCKIWASKCRRGEPDIEFDTKYICSEHFVPEDFERDYQSELMGAPRQRGL